GYHIDTISMKSDGDTKVPGQIAIPESNNPHPAILVFGSIQSSDIDRLAKAGRIVAALEPRPSPAGTESIKTPYLGIFILVSLRAFLAGRTIIGLRIDDVIRAMDWLSSRKDVQRSAITVYGEGASGMVVLHAAVLDERIRRVVIENSLVSYRSVVD